jgi:anaerobic selenocysteine-containing dehydrogenase
VPLADLHLPVRINGDIALCKGLMKVMLEQDRINGGVVDHEFIRSHTSGFEELLADLNSTAWEDIEAGSGLSRSQIEEAGLMVAGAKRMICCWAMGLTQHRDAVATIRMLVNLLLMGGHIGRPGAGTCCVRGHSNVQGDRTMGIWERPVGPFLDALEREFGFRPPHRMGTRHGRYHQGDAGWCRSKSSSDWAATFSRQPLTLSVPRRRCAAAA